MVATDLTVSTAEAKGISFHLKVDELIQFQLE